MPASVRLDQGVNLRGTNHKLSVEASGSESAALREGDWTQTPRAWRGRGRVRAAADPDGAVVVRVAGLTTQARAYKTAVGAFFRKEWRARPNPAGRYAVEILIDAPEDGPAHDIDNVAKALLDSLTGAVFRDDSQVWRLVVERRVADRAGVWARVTPWAPAR